MLRAIKCRIKIKFWAVRTRNCWKHNIESIGQLKLKNSVQSEPELEVYNNNIFCTITVGLFAAL